jgi:hypothetical protein
VKKAEGPREGERGEGERGRGESKLQQAFDAPKEKIFFLQRFCSLI